MIFFLLEVIHELGTREGGERVVCANAYAKVQEKGWGWGQTSEKDLYVPCVWLRNTAVTLIKVTDYGKGSSIKHIRTKREGGGGGGGGVRV